MNDGQTNNQAGMSTLVQGIVGDIGQLLKHEVQFARKEIESDLTKVRAAAVILGSGIAAGLVGFVLFGLMLAEFLHWSTMPVNVTSDVARVPLWACYGIIAAIFIGAGTALGMFGCNQLSKVNPMPDKTLETVQENVSWIANQTANSK